MANWERDQLELQGGQIDKLWELTKPQDPYAAHIYRDCLSYVLTNENPMNHYDPFYVPRKEGPDRLIFRAHQEMATVQWVLADWLTVHLPRSDGYWLDYWFRGGVKPAINEHRQANYALVFDMDNAFESVTANALGAELEHGLPLYSYPVVPTIANLLTVNGRVRQGCVSSREAYNVVMRPIDLDMIDSLGSLGGEVWTRYNDNSCISSKEPFDVDSAEERVRRLFESYGFALSWTKRFTKEPIEYLGRSIFHGAITVIPDKIYEYLERIDQASASLSPQAHRKKITGTYSAIRSVYRDNIPEELLVSLATYYARYQVGNPPKSLLTLLSRRQQYQMF